MLLRSINTNAEPENLLLSKKLCNSAFHRNFVCAKTFPHKLHKIRMIRSFLFIKTDYKNFFTKLHFFLILNKPFFIYKKKLYLCSKFFLLTINFFYNMKKLLLFSAVLVLFGNINAQKAQRHTTDFDATSKISRSNSETGATTAQTLFRAPGDVILSEGFEGTTGNTLPAGWTRTTSATGVADPNTGEIDPFVPVGWIITSDLQQGETSMGISAHGGTRYAGLNTRLQKAATNAWLFSPAITLKKDVSYTFKFWVITYGNENEGVEEYDYLKVHIGMMATATAMEMIPAIYDNKTERYSNWTLVTRIYTSPMNITGYIGFNAYTPAGKGLYIVIDDIQVSETIDAAECDPVTTFPWKEDFTAGQPECWQVLGGDNVTESSWLFIPLEGNGVAESFSYNPFNDDPVIPDNWLVTPELALGNEDYTLSFKVGAMEPDFFAEKYSVLVSTTGTNKSDFTKELLTETLTASDSKTVTLSLSEYAEKNIYIAFRHWGCTDNSALVIDDVVVDINVPTPIEVLTKTPSNGTSNVAINAPVSVKFNQNVTGGDLTGVTISDGTNTVTSSASVEGDKLIINHDDFEYGTNYAVIVPVGAIEGFDEIITWAFKTIIYNSIPVVNDNEINIFQNNGNIFVQPSENSDVRVLNVLGKVLGNYNVAANATLTVNQPSGIYLIEVISSGNVSTHKVVVK